MNSVALKDISKSITSGLTPLRSNVKFWDDGDVPWVKTEQLGEKYVCDSNEKITRYALSNTSVKLNPANTVSIAMYGEGKTRGSVSILKIPTTTNQACCNLVIDEMKADFEFVYYSLKTHYKNLRNLSSGVRKNLNSNDIKNFEIRLPQSIKEQKKIAKVLSDLDAKIDLNNKINAELEAMAKLIYDYWFVQFDFPTPAEYAQAVGWPEMEGKPYKSSGGKMVYDERLKREIPEGWEIGALTDIATYTNGIACQKYRPDSDDFLPVIKIREMRDGITDNTEKVKADIPDKVKVFDGDVLFSWSASLEVMLWSGGDAGLNQHIFKVTSRKYPKSFYFFELRNYLNHFKMVANLRKTTMGHITREHLNFSKISIPPSKIIEDLDKKISSMLDQQVQLNKQNQQLSALRDWLLPMLMNGQVKVE